MFFYLSFFLSMLMLISFTVLHFLAAKHAAADPLAPALYVFGDSLFDSGNNNFLPTLAKADFPPYGLNFNKGFTGRFTNGRTVADFIAEFIGLPYSPPYLSIRKLGRLTGLNYASGSCGILPETGRIFGLCLNLDAQITLFQETVKLELPKHFKKASNDLAIYLSKSLFIVSTGSNDYINNYLQPEEHDTSRRYTPQAFAQHLVDVLYQRLERLYRLGARKIVVFEIGPIGCIPSITRHRGECDEDTNQLALYFNQRLPQMLKDLTSSHQNSSFVLGQVNGLGYNAIKNPSSYGLTDTSNPCCSTWGNGTLSCIPLLKPCTNNDRHFFWDAFHLTETIYSVISNRCFNGSSVCIPMNIKQLLEN